MSTGVIKDHDDLPDKMSHGQFPVGLLDPISRNGWSSDRANVVETLYPNGQSQTRDRRFCQAFLGCCGIMFLAIGAANFVVNPYAQYPTHWFEPLAQDSRAQKLELLDEYSSTPPVPQGLVLGSSRVLKMEPEYLEQKTGLRFFNAGVNYGKPEDFLALLRYYQDTFLQAPEMVVVGLDVNAFSDGATLDARLISNPTLARRVPEAIHSSDRMLRWQELLSWQQTKTSVTSLKLHLLSDSMPEPVESFRSDGMIVYHQRERELAAGTYDFDSALAYNQNEYKHFFHAFTNMSGPRCEMFETFAKICQSNRTKLIVYLTPMHPDLVRYLEQHTEYRQRQSQVTAFLQTQAAEQRFTWFDLSDIESFAGHSSLFVDGIHPLEPNTRRIIDRILASPRKSGNYAVQ